jgi:hypothetical protein
VQARVPELAALAGLLAMPLPPPARHFADGGVVARGAGGATRERSGLHPPRAAICAARSSWAGRRGRASAGASPRRGLTSHLPPGASDPSAHHPSAHARRPIGLATARRRWACHPGRAGGPGGPAGCSMPTSPSRSASCAGRHGVAAGGRAPPE